MTRKIAANISYMATVYVSPLGKVQQRIDTIESQYYCRTEGPAESATLLSLVVKTIECYSLVNCCRLELNTMYAMHVPGVVMMQT